MIVAFTVSCLRERYLRAAIESWARVRGVRDATLLFALEPAAYRFPVAEFEAFLERSFPGRWQVHVAESPLGCLRNTRRALELALGQEDFAVLAEEDLQVADDTLEYLAWARDAYRGDPQVQAVCAHARASRSDDPAAVSRACWFNPLVWGTWKDRWEQLLAPEWGPEQEGQGNPESWDRKLMLTFHSRRLCSVFPLRSRSVHRGELSTQYFHELGRMFWPSSVSECFAPHYAPQDYREVPYPDGLVV